MSEKQLYTKILELTHYKSNGLRLLDYEDTDLVVNAQFKKFAECYRPLLTQLQPFINNVKLTPEPGMPINTAILGDKEGIIKFVRAFAVP